MAHGKTLRLFLVDGHPQGIVIAEVINWTGQVTRVPRAQLTHYLQRPDSRRTGAYVLTGPDVEMPDRLRIYVGESENIGDRLKQHVVDQDKDFWEDAYAISSKDGNITKSHALFLEALIRRDAINSGRHAIENVKRNDYSNIPESDRSDMISFGEQVAVILSALGLDLFTSERRAPSVEQNADRAPSVATRLPSIDRPVLPGHVALELSDEKHGVLASGYEIDGKILVEAGSRVREDKYTSNSYSLLRQRLIDKKILGASSDTGNLLFLEQYLFDSPSAASAVILNRNDNGRRSWKVKATGKTLNEFYAEQIGKAHQPDDKTMAASTPSGATYEPAPP